MDTRAFIETLYCRPRSEAEGFLTIWDKQTKKSAHFDIRGGVDAAVVHTESVVAASHDSYFGTCLRRAGLVGSQRGTKGDVVCAPGLWLDVDLQGPGHVAKNLPVDIDAGCAIVESCPFPPTLVNDSGWGLHAYWLFEMPVMLARGDVERYHNASKLFQKIMISAAHSKGLHVDQTGNLDRVLRLPGAVNFKIPGDPKQVSVLVSDPVFYDPAMLIQAATRVSVAVPATVPSSPARLVNPADALAEIKTRLTHLSNAGNRKLMAEVLAGRSFAQPGERDAQLQKTASIVAFTAPVGTDPVTAAELFRPSIDAMARESDDPSNPALTFESVVEKLGRALADAATKRAADAEFRKTFLGSPEARQTNGHTSASPSASGDAGIYTADELADFASSQGTTLEGFRQRWIIQHGTAYYVFVNGGYKYPVPKDALLTKLRDDLVAAKDVGVRLWTVNKDGSDRKMSIQEVLDNYGTVARQARGSLMLGKSFYNADTEIYWEALCPARNIQPKYDPVIEEWLKLLGGDQEDRLLDWIATIGQLEEQSSALYMSGKAGAGKTLLAHGLARFWTEGGPTELSDVVGNSFNSGIARCPIIFGDEAMTCSTTDLRRLIGSSVHTLRRKYLPNMDIVGSLRVILADNGGRMLIQDEEINGEDLEAVASKFLHISVGQEPVDFLKSLGGRSGTEDWVSGDRIACHAMWLRQNRQVVPGGRFIVEGHVTSMTRLLAVQGKIAGLVCEWVAGYLDKPIPNINQQGSIIVGSGRILINVDAISTHWSHYIQSEKTAFSKSRIGAALGNLSDGVHRVGAHRYHNVKPDLIYEWAEKNLVGDIAAMRARVEASVVAEATKTS